MYQKVQEKKGFFFFFLKPIVDTCFAGESLASLAASDIKLGSVCQRLLSSIVRRWMTEAALRESTVILGNECHNTDGFYFQF